MYNPRPVLPQSDFDTNLVDSFGSISESIPVHLSFTLTITWLFLLSISIAKDISSFCVNFIALSIRLQITCLILYLSAIRGVDSSSNGLEKERVMRLYLVKISFCDLLLFLVTLVRNYENQNHFLLAIHLFRHFSHL